MVHDTTMAVLYWTHGWSFEDVPRSLESYDDIIDIADANAAELFFTETIFPLLYPQVSSALRNYLKS